MAVILEPGAPLRRTPEFPTAAVGTYRTLFFINYQEINA